MNGSITTISADMNLVQTPRPGHRKTRRVSPDSRSLWHLIESIAIAMAQGYGLARTRALSHAAPMTRMLGQRDHLYTETAMLEREVAIFRAQRMAKAPRRRPQFDPRQRAEILQLSVLRGWSSKQTALRFGVHPNTIRNWRRSLRDKGRAERLLGEPPWNRLHEAVRWTVHEIRRICPEREFGTRTIALHMIRAGIQISRTSIRRILEEERCKTDRWQRHVPTPDPGDATHLMNPKAPHFVWHTDITEIRVLWKRFEIAAVLDGYSRKLLGIKAFNRRVTTNDMTSLINECAVQSGTTPRFLISDRGSQFRVQFTDACRAQGIVHVRCKVRVWQLNAKIERFFSTLKSWLRPSCLIPTEARIQERLDEFQLWYNEHRVHGAHSAHTPNEQLVGVEREPVRFTHRGCVEPTIQIDRKSTRDDPKLFQLNIKVYEQERVA